MAGNREYKYPGIDLPLRQSDEGAYAIARHLDADDPSDPSCLLQIREVAMMILMDRLTDKPNWHERVFNQDIVDAWIRDTFTQSEEQVYESIVYYDSKMPARTRIISEKAFDNSIAELRNKAAFFEETGLIPTLDAHHFTIIKSDTLTTPGLHYVLENSFAKLMADQASNPDWHPWTQDLVRDVVHPSSYPFVYNRSRFIHEEVVGVTDAIYTWSGKGQIPVQKLKKPKRDRKDMFIPEDFWCEKYQWLPANLAFREDGSVRFTSYINNLHPQRYSDFYTAIEKLIDIAIPAWDHALTWKENSAATCSRFTPPPECHWGVLKAAERDAEVAWDGGDLEIDNEVENKHSDDEINNADEDTQEQWREEAVTQLKWERIRDPILPEPDHVRHYNSDCSESIREKFKETGLQVIVKMASIELSPEKPTLPPAGWHIEGQLNEHIIATALVRDIYAYTTDEENIEPIALSFRQPTHWKQPELEERMGQDVRIENPSRYEYYERIFGVSLDPEIFTECVQNYGSVETKPGRLLVFPNTFDHRVSGCTLKDKTKPGYRRFIALWLVNPEMRIISTANVPPQQLDWWLGSVIGDIEKGVKGQVPPEIMQLVLENTGENVANESETGISVEALQKLSGSHTSSLPPEILDMIRERENETMGALMTVKEARQHRQALMGGAKPVS
ncbi:Protein of unknown function (DUF4246) domain containing protein [Rhypophila decipiens]